MINDNIVIHADSINVEAIMQEIRSNITKRDIENIVLPDLNDIRLIYSGSTKNAFDMDEFNRNISNNNMKCNVIIDKPITSHRRFSGKLIIFAKKVIRKILKWYINSIFDQQNEFNSSVTRSFNDVNKYIQLLEEKVNRYECAFGDIDDIYQNSKKLQNRYDEISQQVLNIKEIIINEENEKRNIQDKLAKIENDVASFNHKDLLLSTKIRKLEHNARGQNNLFSVNVNENRIDDQIDFDYFMFEERHRGTQKDIQQRLSIYVDYFKEKENVLDIGCGRGEFLNLLIDHNISVKGIDINEDMIAYCQEKGLPVEKADVITYLESIPDNSLGGIFLGQVIEHLQPNTLIHLIRLAYKKLSAGAYFIAETINPQSLIVFTECYFLDPSHVRMVHPFTIQFILESEGFRNINLNYLSKVEDNLRIPQLVIENGKNLEQFNHSIQVLNDIVYGYRDYAIVGKK